MKRRTAKGLTISRRQNGSWRAQIRKVGFPHATKDFLTYDEADAWGLQRLEELRVTGSLVDRRSSERTTLVTVIDAYLVEVTAKRPGEASRIAETARLNRFKREEKQLASHAVAYLTPEMFEAWRERRLTESVSRGAEDGRGRYKPEIVPAGRTRADGRPRKNAAAIKRPETPKRTISPGTVRREMTLLKRVLDFAIKKYKLASNPLSLVDRPSVQDERDVRLTDAEIGRLLDECRKAKNSWLAPMVELAFEIGARRGSFFKLNWSDVRLSKQTLILRGVKNSNRPNEIRTVEVGLSPRAVEILEVLPRSLDGRVFPTTISAVEAAFKRARTRAGLEHFRFHDSRHDLASRLVEAGWELLPVMKQGDWRDPKSLARYFNAKGEHLGAKLAMVSGRRRGEAP